MSMPSNLDDDTLTAALGDLARDHRRTTVHLILHLAEFEARDLHLKAGFTSLFGYCTTVLRLSEWEAYHRIEAARDIRRFPVLRERLLTGSLTLTTLRLVAGHLTRENHLALLDAAGGKTKREVEVLLAGLRPRADVPDVVRKVPVRAVARTEPAAATMASTVRAPGLSPAAAGTPAHSADVGPPPVPKGSVAPLSAERCEIRFTAGRETKAKLEHARALLRHAVPSGDLAQVFDRALTLLVAELERRKFGAPDGRQGPSRVPVTSTSRHIPAEVRRIVYERDGGRCAFVAVGGRRCEARTFLELHHVVPYAAGGDRSADNLQLRCAAHNRYEADVFYAPSKAGRLDQEMSNSVRAEFRPGSERGMHPGSRGT